MILYHFTAKKFLDGIIREGLTKGMIPIFLNDGSLGGFKRGNWLTKNPEFLQTWCDPKYSSLPYDRSAVRLTFDLPLDFVDSQIHKWTSFAIKNGLSVTASILGKFGDPDNWFIARGRVSPDFIKTIDLKENSS